MSSIRRVVAQSFASDYGIVERRREAVPTLRGLSLVAGHFMFTLNPIGQSACPRGVVGSFPVTSNVVPHRLDQRYVQKLASRLISLTANNTPLLPSTIDEEATPVRREGAPVRHLCPLRVLG
jgi:hypothetical protein